MDKVVDYKQYDRRWADLPYTSCGNPKQTIRSSGCGVVSVCDVLATLISPKITPLSVGPMLVKAGFRTKNSGTSWAAFKWIANKYKFLSFRQTSSLATAKKYIRYGGLVVCSMSKGYWTTGGHYICMTGYDDKYIYANDPASSVRHRQLQDQFIKECRQYFCYLA